MSAAHARIAARNRAEAALGHDDQTAFIVLSLARALLRAEAAANIGGKIMQGEGSHPALEEPIGIADGLYLNALSLAKRITQAPVSTQVPDSLTG